MATQTTAIDPIDAPTDTPTGKIDPRKMALQIAGLRANETHLPENERVFQDPYAERFFPTEARQILLDPALVKAELGKYEQMMPGVNGAIVARIKFIDTLLADCIADGIAQLVIIGAGYDTRAYRIEGVREHLQVFEVDHPTTQAVKTETIKEIFGRLPDHVVYVPVIFGQERLDQKLAAYGYTAAKKSLFIIEGLLMYIPPVAVDGLLAFIANGSAPGSSFVADYFDTTVIDGSSALKEAQVLRQFVESEGSRLQFGIQSGEEEAFFKARGFDRVTCVTSASCKERFFINDSRKRTVSPMFNFIHATVRSA